MRSRFQILLAAALAALLLPADALGAPAVSEERFVLSAKELAENGRVPLPVRWKYHPGDDPSFAVPFLDDSTWQTADTRLSSSERPAEWRGLGWFRLRFEVDARLPGEALSLHVHQFGAAEIYLDGEPLLALGTAAPDREAVVPHLQRRPLVFSFDERRSHVLAVRFSNHDPDAFEAAGKLAGFVVTIAEANERIAAFGQDARSSSAYQAFFCGVFAAFALLHLLFFAFYRESAENLYFALLASAIAGLVYLFLEGFLTTDPRLFLVFEGGLNLGWLAISIFALRFVYSVFRDRPPRRLWGAVAAALLLAVPAWLWPLETRPWTSLLVLLASLEMVRTVLVAIFRRTSGAGIVGLGILALVSGTAVGLVAHLELLPWSIATAFLIPASSVLVLILSMSIYLSRGFARTSRELRARLHQVEELSAQKLAQERRAREDEVERRLLEARYQRKVEELEEARQLQLSMLPEHLPEVPGLDIAASMFTATEVGGDYYDFDLADDGTLTVAVGDATGHGMKAGTLVTATKSLFQGLDGGSELPDTLARFGRALKRMNLRQLKMSLALARFKDGRLRLTAAGMPPALVYRARTGRVESIQLEGMPLGGIASFPYEQRELELGPGDTLLLMSDGFPERLNRSHEMFGYEQAFESFSRVATTAPETIIEGLVADGEAWARGEPSADDITFVVLQRQAA